MRFENDRFSEAHAFSVAFVSFILCRRRKQRQLRRREAEGKEADDEEKQQHIDRQQRQPEAGAAHFKAAGQKKGQQDAEDKDQNIQRQKIPPQQSGVSEKSGRDKKHSNADRQKPGCEKMPGGLIQHDDFKKGIEQHRKKQKL